MNIYYEIETLLNQLPQRKLAQSLQQLIYDLVYEEKVNQNVLDVEKYFRNLIKKIELYYCRRLQKLEYFVSKQCDKSLLLMRIGKYLVKKPWHLDNYDYKVVKLREDKLDDKNCNQILQINECELDILSSKTSTPFSHYSMLPYSIKDNSLNQAICFDYADSHSNKSDRDTSINISDLQVQLERIANQQVSDGLHDAKLADLDIGDNFLDNEHQFDDDQIVDQLDCQLDDSNILNVDNDFNQIDFDVSDIKITSNKHIDEQVNQFNLDMELDVDYQQMDFDQDIESVRALNIKSILSPNRPPQLDDLDQLFQTKQSTKEILKYVEQYQRDQLFQCETTSQQEKYRHNSQFDNERQNQYSPQVIKRYRVRSSYQREVPQVRLKSNVSSETFDMRTLPQRNKLRVNMLLPSPLSIMSPIGLQSKQPKKKKKLLQPVPSKVIIPNQNHMHGIYRMYKQMSTNSKQQQSATGIKRNTRPLLSYSVDKNGRLEYNNNNDMLTKKKSHSQTHSEY